MLDVDLALLQLRKRQAEDRHLLLFNRLLTLMKGMIWLCENDTAMVMIEEAFLKLFNDKIRLLVKIDKNKS